MIGAGEGYTLAGAVAPSLYHPAAPLAAEAAAGVLRGAYVVGHQHGRCLARSVLGIPQQASLASVPTAPTTWTEITGARWRVYVPAEVSTLTLVADVVLVPNSQAVLEHRLVVTDGTNTDTGETVELRVTNAAVTTPVAQPGLPWPGPLVATRRERVTMAVALDTVSPGARLDIYADARALGYVGRLFVGLALYWSAA